MDKLLKLEIAARDLIQYYCPSYTFIWDRSKRRKGHCRRDVKQIGISKPLAEINTFESMLLAVIHEIAHALTTGGHTEEWAALCLSLGGDGLRTYNASNTVSLGKPYAGTCPGCNRRIEAFRRKRISCGKCDKRFNPAFLYVWTKNI